MCSLTFVPQPQGYFVAMNRDENLGREVARPPSIHRGGDEVWVGPEEVSTSGTWIATTGRGITMALLNVHPSQETDNDGTWRSRGMLIPQLIAAIDRKIFEAGVATIRLSEFKPFQLAAIFPHERAVLSHRWDGARLGVERYSWSFRQVFSSGKSDAIATKTRSATAKALPRRVGESEQDWLRRLHSSHVPERGAFSYCVHRADARTVSYTEVVVEEDSITMHYHDGSPCDFNADSGFQHSVCLQRQTSALADRS